MKFLVTLLYLGHYVSLAFGLSTIISSIISIVKIMLYFFQNDYQFNWSLYKETLWLFIGPLATIFFLILIVIRIISIWNLSLKNSFIVKLHKPIDDFFNQFKTSK